MIRGGSLFLFLLNFLLSVFFFFPFAVVGAVDADVDGGGGGAVAALFSAAIWLLEIKTE